jgi:hypothetical protein
LYFAGLSVLHFCSYRFISFAFVGLSVLSTFVVLTTTYNILVVIP